LSVSGGQNGHGLSPEAILTVAGGGKTAALYGERTAIFQQGDVADALYFIQSGRTSIAAVSNDGKQAVLGILGAGDFFGECCLTGNVHRLVSATTVTESSLVRMEKDALIDALSHEPTFAKMFLSRMLAAKTRVEQTLATHIFDNSEVRLAKTLLYLARFGEQDRPEVVIEKVSQETLAQMIGTTRSRVNYFMNKFRRLGYVDYNGDIHVHRSLLNVVLQGPTQDDDGSDAD
jgi:CRP/FNR family transcriptional regulator, cyclic AMP receptor protein